MFSDHFLVAPSKDDSCQIGRCVFPHNEKSNHRVQGLLRPFATTAGVVGMASVHVTPCLNTLECVSMSEWLTITVLVTHIPSEVVLIHTVCVCISETIDECV